MYNMLRMFDIHIHIHICLTLRMFSKINIYIYICPWEMERGILLYYYCLCKKFITQHVSFLPKKIFANYISKAFISKYTEH